jgi:glyoxylase-like metal-dependent hydrolase (beta-lactamase superfamily II)
MMSCLVGGLSAAWLCSAPASAEQAADIKLYALDCGHASFKDAGLFSDTGEYDGKPRELVDPCYLIRHPKGTLLWDTGLGDPLAANPGGVDNNGIHLSVPKTLESQLAALGLKADDITYVAFSHFHFDHTGNANLFMHSTWILNSLELEAVLGPKPPFGADKAPISGYSKVHTQMIDGDYDVFGDGSVRILKMPGHTPGHQSLIVRLPHSGAVMLSGDLYHTLQNRRERLVPPINTERADTLASMDRFERIASRTHARVIVQHAPEDFAAFPKFPAFLD